jgi:type II secretory pathway pseudopilin PulG
MPAMLRTPAGEDGYSVVEMLVAMTISIIVLLATLQSLDVFTTSAARQTRQTDANDQVRSTTDRVVGDLRGASAILRAAATDLVYAVPATSTSTRVERLCVDTTGTGSSMRTDLYTSSTVTASPAVPTAACSAGTRIANLQSAANTAFTYDGASSSTTPGLVTNVGLTFSLDSSIAGKSASSTLTASAARRSAGTLPITDGDLQSECNSSGALLSLSATLPNIAPLTVTYSSVGGVSFGPVTVNYAASGGATLGTPSGVTVQIPAGTASVLATVTNALGVRNIIRKDVTCST